MVADYPGKVHFHYDVGDTRPKKKKGTKPSQLSNKENEDIVAVENK